MFQSLNLSASSCEESAHVFYICDYKPLVQHFKEVLWIVPGRMPLNTVRPLLVLVIIWFTAVVLVVGVVHRLHVVRLIHYRMGISTTHLTCYNNFLLDVRVWKTGLNGEERKWFCSLKMNYYEYGKSRQ